MESCKSKNGSNWTILCPGPSLNKVSLSEDIDKSNQIIAVNGAIVFSNILTDWWAVSDPEVFATVISLISFSDIKKIRSLPKIWTYWGFEEMGYSKNVGNWNDKTKATFKMFENEVWHREENPEDIKKQYPECITPFMTYEYIPWNEFTLFAAISLAIKKGARTINIYGAQFSNIGYFHGGLCNWRMNHSEKRWMREKIFFYYIVDHCQKQNVEIRRISVK